MRLYEVGGAVRDALLGLPAQDRDWVAVGATPEELLALGYKPVGRDFPVFLHPVTHEEVALARTERKSAPGYHGFSFHAAPEVTLEQDLSRRDLARIEQMWSERLRSSSGGPMLMGTFGAIDAYFAPVCTRIRTYGLPVSAAVGAYVDRIHLLPSFQRWHAAALAEHDFIVEDEPYRKTRNGAA